MGWLLRKCEKCHVYTLNKEKCPKCGGKVHVPHPPKFSPHDKYIKYRIMLKEGRNKNERNIRQTT
jgi:H/ACA ribonucleoprotein complex subunit 3